MPQIVKDFVKRLRPSPGTYVFGIATCGGMTGASLRTLDTLLKKNGSRLSAGFKLKMPNNAYIGINRITPPEQRYTIIRSSEDSLRAMIEIIKRQKTVGFESSATLVYEIGGFLMFTYAEKIYQVQKKFHVTDACNACGTCVKVCPVCNIMLSNNNVEWGDNCIHCMACFHWCPKTAIQIGSKTANIVLKRG